MRNWGPLKVQLLCIQFIWKVIQEGTVTGYGLGVGKGEDGSECGICLATVTCDMFILHRTF